MLNTTVGKLVVEDALPEGMKDWAQLSFNKKTLGAFMSELAQKHPEEYRDVTHKLLQIARRGALESGSNSFGLKHIRVSPVAKARREKLLKEIEKINDDDSLSDEARTNKLVKTIARAKEGFEAELMAEAKAEGSPLERMISSGARGNPGSLASLRGGDFQYVDSEGKALPVPITKSYGEGLDPVSYWAGSFGARQGLLSAKFSTAESGYFAKRLQQAAHRLLVTGIDEDHERESDEIRGMPADSNDPHNEGSLLAHPAGGYAKNTILTPKILQDLQKRGIGRILVRSPIVGGAKDGGLLARDVGIRESGNLPHPGSLVGLLAAQSIAERLSQQALGAKHLGGIAGKGVEQLTQGFPLVEQLVDIPKAFKGGATHAQTDGVVQAVHEAPAGGMYVTVNDHDHYVPMGHMPLVGRGDTIEAGDMLSTGIPNPSEIVKHKGIGEGRRYFTHQLAGVLQQAGVNAHRRNVELVARAMVDHVKMNDEFSDWLPGDVVSYQTLERNWHPREGFKELEPKAALGHYLEKPVLHYTVGTKIQPSMLKDMEGFGVKKLVVHETPPPFEPLMVRSEDSLHHDPDWVTQMYGSGLKKNLLKSVHRGAVSDEKGTSFVPSLAKGVNFGLAEPFDKLNKKMGEEKKANSDIYGGELMPENYPATNKPVELSPEAQNASDTIRSNFHYLTHPFEMDEDSKTPYTVLNAPLDNPKEYWHYLTNPGERDKDLGFIHNMHRALATAPKAVAGAFTLPGGFITNYVIEPTLGNVLPDSVNPYSIIDREAEEIIGAKPFPISGNPSEDLGLADPRDENGNPIVTTPSQIRKYNFENTPTPSGKPRQSRATADLATELGVELTGDPTRDKYRVEDAIYGQEQAELKAQGIAARKEQAAIQAIQRQEQELQAVRDANPPSPELKGEQVAAQFSIDHPGFDYPGYGLGGTREEQAAREYQDTQQFIAQHQAPKLNAEEQAALAKARNSVTPEMMAQYGPRQDWGSMQREDLRREAAGLPRKARSLGEIAGASLYEQPLASRMTSLADIPHNQYVTKTPDNNTGQVLSNQIASIKGSPASAPKPLPQPPNVAAKPTAPPIAQPPKMPTPPGMAATGSTPKLPLVPGGTS